MAVQKTASGRVDKRTKEYKEMVERAQKARASQKTTSIAKKSSSSAPKRADGKLDKRTKEYKEVAERMAEVRKAKNSLKNKIKRLFK